MLSAYNDVCQPSHFKQNCSGILRRVVVLSITDFRNIFQTSGSEFFLADIVMPGEPTGMTRRTAAAERQFLPSGLM